MQENLEVISFLLGRCIRGCDTALDELLALHFKEFFIPLKLGVDEAFLGSPGAFLCFILCPFDGLGEEEVTVAASAFSEGKEEVRI